MLGTVDFIVMGVFLAICLGIGLYFSLAGGRQSNTNEYFFGDRKLKILPVSISMFVSFSSAILILGSSAEVYNYGINYWLWMIAELLCIPFSAFLIVPVFFDTGSATVTQYLGRRFNSEIIRKVTSIVYIGRMLTYMSLCFLAPSLAFQAGTNFPVWAIILISAAVATIYTAIGGIKAVVWTDTLQGVVLVGGLITVLVKSCIDAGGWKAMFQTGYDHGRVYIFNLDPDPTQRDTLWTIVIGAFFSLMPSYGFSQESIQRVMSLPSKKKAQTSYMVMLPISLVVNSLCMCIGVAVFAFYAATKRCDLVEAGIVQSSNQALPYYVFNELNHLYGFGGLFLASLYSGALSSVSSGLNGIAVMIWEDFLGPKWKSRYTPKQAANISKIVVCVLGCVAAVFAVGLSFLPGTIVQVTGVALGAFGGPITGIFFLAFFFPWANYEGALVGAACGMATVLWIALGRLLNRLDWPKLPSFTTEGCDSANTTSALLNVTSSLASTTVGLVNVTGPGYSVADSSGPPYALTTLGPTMEELGWKKLYLLNYFYYVLLGLIVTVIVANIVSCCTGVTKVKDVDILCFSPPIRWVLRRRGYYAINEAGQRRQNMADWNEKNNNPDAKETVPLKERE